MSFSLISLTMKIINHQIILWSQAHEAGTHSTDDKNEVERGSCAWSSWVQCPSWSGNWTVNTIYLLMRPKPVLTWWVCNPLKARNCSHEGRLSHSLPVTVGVNTDTCMLQATHETKGSIYKSSWLWEVVKARASLPSLPCTSYPTYVC